MLSDEGQPDWHFVDCVLGARDFSFGKARPSSNMGILEKISEIEKEIARTQKNKGQPRTAAVFNLLRGVDKKSHTLFPTY